MFTHTNQKLISVPEAPSLPGLLFRGFEGEDDYPRMLAIISACKEADQVERADTLEDIRRNYSHLVNSDPYEDMLFVEMRGEAVGYSRVSWYWSENEGERVFSSFGFLHPAWRRKRIGTAMLHWNQERLRQIASSHPQKGIFLFESFSKDTEFGTEALLRVDGYVPVRHFFQMVRPHLEDIPDLPLPNGLEIRPVKPDEYRKVWQASVEAFRDHWGFDANAESFESWFDHRNQQPALWQVAWAGDEVAGMVLPFIDDEENRIYHRKRGWTENICVRRPWRGKGLAKALIARSLQLLKDLGMKEACLGVDSQNISGALRLYEMMGYRTIRHSTNWRKPMILSL